MHKLVPRPSCQVCYLKKLIPVCCFVLLNEDKKGLSSQIFSWVVPGPGGQDQLESSHKKLLRDLRITTLILPPSTAVSTCTNVLCNVV